MSSRKRSGVLQPQATFISHPLGQNESRATPVRASVLKDGAPGGKEYNTALLLYEEACRIYRSLVQAAPDMVQWTKEQQSIEADLVRCRGKVK